MSIKSLFDYARNTDTRNGEVISYYKCNSKTAECGFALAKINIVQ